MDYKKKKLPARKTGKKPLDSRCKECREEYL